MFWRKNNQPLYVAYPQTNRRRDYRVEPSAQIPIRLSISGVMVTLIDISANGVSFEPSAQIQLSGDSTNLTPALIYLGQEHHPIPVSLELISQNERSVRCHIVHHTLGSQKILSRFIVKQQKLQIRNAHAAETAADEQRPHPSN